MSSRTELLAFIDYVLAIVQNSKSVDEAYEEILRMRNDIQAGAWEEVLSKIKRRY